MPLRIIFDVTHMSNEDIFYSKDKRTYAHLIHEGRVKERGRGRAEKHYIENRWPMKLR